MNKETVIAYLHSEISVSDSFALYLSQFPDAWFSRNGGDVFLGEFGHTWNTNFLETVQRFYQDHFRQLGLSEEQLPNVTLTDYRSGSWIMEAAVVMLGTVGTTYTILKGIAELPKIADGLEETKKRVQLELQNKFRKTVPERIEPVISNLNLDPQVASSLNPIPPTSVNVSFSIDARPLRALTPDEIKTHAIHLSVGVSRSALAIENLGDKPIENLRIGLFKSLAERHNWNFGEAYVKSVPILSAKQSLSLAIADFSAFSGGEKLLLTDDCPLYVDCWLQDNSGIYLFNFYLE